MYAKKRTVAKKPAAKPKFKPRAKTQVKAKKPLLSLYKRSSKHSKSRRSYHRRSYHNTHASGTHISIIKPHGDALMSDRVSTKLRFSHVKNLTGILTSAVVTNKYSINNPYDPDLTSGTANQPRFWDQYATYYNRFRCYGAAVEVTFTLQTTGNIGVSIGGIDPSDSSTAPVDFDDACEQNFRTIMLNDQGSYKLKEYFNPAKAWGVSKRRYDTDDVFSGTMTGGPPWLANFFLLIQNIGTESSVNVNYHIKITYYTNFFSPKTVAPSLFEAVFKEALAKQQKLEEYAKTLPEPESDSDTTEVGLDDLTKSQLTKVIKAIKK